MPTTLFVHVVQAQQCAVCAGSSLLLLSRYWIVHYVVSGCGCDSLPLPICYDHSGHVGKCSIQFTKHYICTADHIVRSAELAIHVHSELWLVLSLQWSLASLKWCGSLVAGGVYIVGSVTMCL